MNGIIRTSVAIVVLAAWLPAWAVSQPNSNGEKSATASAQPVAPVIVDGRVLFSLRGISSISAAYRADNVAERIKAIAADKTFSVEDLSIEEVKDQTNIKAGNRLVMAIFDADAVLEGESVPREILAKANMLKIAEAIKSYRLDRSRTVLISNIIYSAGTLIALAVLLFLIVRLFRRLETRIETRYRSTIQGVRIQSVQLVQAEQLWSAVRGILRMVRTLLLLTVLLVCIEYVLSLYPWTRYIAYRTITLLLDPLRSMAGSILAAVPNLIFILVLILIARYILKLARLFFVSVENGTVVLVSFDREWALPTYKIFRYLVVIFAAVVAYPYVPGSGSEAFKGVSIFVGVLFSLGSTSFVSNTIAGYALIYRRLFRVGDRVQIGEHIGDVQEIRLQVTHLHTIKNEEIIVPNSEILGSNVINYSTLAQKQGLILHTTVGIGYETPWRKVEAMLLMAAQRTDGLLRQPPPFVLQKSLDDFFVTYEINAYCDKPQASHLRYAELHRNILDLFNEYGVQIMTPAYEGDPKQAKVVPKDRWFEPPASPPDESGRT